MARGRPRKVGKKTISNSKGKRNGPGSVSDELRTKSVDEVLGIRPLDFSGSDEESIEGADELQQFAQENQRIASEIEADVAGLVSPILQMKDVKKIINGGMNAYQVEIWSLQG